MNDDQRQIEGCLLSEAISTEVSWENSVREQCILTLGLWKAQQLPVVARRYDIPAEAVEQAGRAKMDTETDS